MASTKAYLDFILDQFAAAGLEGVAVRPMMGEYLLGFRGRIFGGIYDDRFLVRPVKSAQAMMPDAPRELPYDGAKEMLLVENADDPAFIKELIEAMWPELPDPAPRKKRKTDT